MSREYTKKIDELYKRAMDSKDPQKREYWLDRYDLAQRKVYRSKKIRLIRKIDDILNTEGKTKERNRK